MHARILLMQRIIGTCEVVHRKADTQLSSYIESISDLVAVGGFEKICAYAQR
jgi:hypothetical protein